MKSIVEEASSIEKAIVNAWTRAGNPQKFTITVFQEPEKNFFGMTTKPAKIGFMFESSRVPSQTKHRKTPQKKITESAQKRTSEQAKSKKHEAPSTNSSNNRFWSQDMVSSTKEWLQKTLALSNKKQAPFSITPQRNLLKITFEKPLVDDPKLERNVFRSLAYLIMQIQRTATKKPLKHHKLVLSSK